MKATPYEEITPLEPEWLWPGRIPRQETTLIAGDGGIGKGFLLADLAARVTRGAPMPDGTGENAPGSVLLVTSEDDPNMAMTYRLRAAGADLARVFDMTEDFVVGKARVNDAPDSLPALRETIEDIGDVRLVVIDPLSAVAAISLTSSNVRVRRQIMTPLERLAKDTGVALALIHHTVKSGSIAGSKGITDAARMVLRVSRATQDERIRLIHVEKTNIASNTGGDVAYRVTGSFPDVRVEYLAMPEDDTLEAKPPTAAELIVAYLTEVGHPVETQTIAQSVGAGYSAVRVALTRLKDAHVVVNPARGLWMLAPVGAASLEVVR
jgi:KaiC/GvpD/RAD55 family RecA-like ATPase